jgi:serine/threonine-protein kinase
LIHIYGVVTGEMNHTNIAHFFHVSETCGGVGIVMKLERGGSLDVLIHGYSNGNRYPKDVTLSDILHILYEIAKGLADMHEVGILHGDIKPNNILLTDTTWPPSIKFTDFGFTSFRESTKLNSTTLLRSTKYRGTPLYSAPEMLVNPFRPAADGKVAKPSRKTDMYAFGLVSWELLCECEVFPTIHDSEVRLCAAVHSNTRPDIALLPRETPDEVKNMIVACWDADRRKRKTARECIDLLEACRKIRFR